MVTGVLVTLEVHLVDTSAFGASVVLEILVEVEVDGVVRVCGVTGASDDTRGPLMFFGVNKAKQTDCSEW